MLVGTQAAVVEAVTGGGNGLRFTTAVTPQPATATPYFLRSELADALTLLTAQAPDTLQELVRRLDARLGADSPVRFRTAPVGGSPALVVDVDWHRTYSTSTPIKLDLVPGQKLAGAGAEGQASVAVAADVDVDLVVPLDEGTSLPSALQVLDTSAVSIEATASLDGSVSATIGPLSVALGNPTVGAPAAQKAQARAHYKLAFAKGAAATGGPVGLGTFLTSVGPVVNDYTGGVDCGAGESGDALALCARLPLYVSTDGETWTKPSGVPDIALRLPKTGSDLFGLTGNVSAGDPRARLSTPTTSQLADAFAALLLDFGTIGDGLDAFLALVSDGLKTASLEGKLPLVGGDLQAGSDFVGDLRTQLDALFAQIEAVNGGKLPTIADVQVFLDTKFRQALTAAGANPENFSLRLTCKLPPSDVTSLSSSAAGAVNQTYGVLAQGQSGADEVPTVLGATMAILTTATGTVTIGFDGVPAATSYLIVRSTDGGGSWQQVKKAPAGSTSAAVAADAAGAVQQIPSSRPTVSSCTGVSMVDLQGVQIRADLGTGDPNAMSGGQVVGCATLTAPGGDKPCLSGTLPLDIGIPGLSLRAARGDDGSAGGLTGRLGYRIHLAVELDRVRGFSLLTEDVDGGGGATPEIAIGAAVDLSTPGTPAAPALKAELAFLKIGVNKTGDAASLARPGFAGRLALDLRAPGARQCFTGCTVADPEARLGFADLQASTSASDVVGLRLDLAVHIEWFLKAGIASALPGVQATLAIDWATSFSPVGGTVADQSKRGGQDLQIAFKDVGISAGSFFATARTDRQADEERHRPAAAGDRHAVRTRSRCCRTCPSWRAAATSPSSRWPRPSAPLPTVPSWTSSTRSPRSSPSSTGCPAAATAWSSPSARSPSAAAWPWPPPRRPTTAAASSEPRPVCRTELKTALDNATTDPAKKSLAGAGSVAAKSGFAFPMLDNPASIFNLLMGQDIDLVDLRLRRPDPGLQLAAELRPGVRAAAGVHHAVGLGLGHRCTSRPGFDTYGIRKAFEDDPDRTALGGIAQVLDGLYFKTADDDGKPLPVSSCTARSLPVPPSAP